MNSKSIPNTKKNTPTLQTNYALTPLFRIPNHTPKIIYPSPSDFRASQHPPHTKYILVVEVVDVVVASIQNREKK